MIDPSRLSAQVISGIGFLGAGTIMKYGTNIRGLTTAATIWAVGIIGICIGAGYYILAFSVSLSLCIVLILFSNIENFLVKRKNVYELHIKFINKNKVMGAINFLLANYQIKIMDVHVEKIDLADVNLLKEFDIPTHMHNLIEMQLIISGKDSSHINEIVENIYKIEGVLFVEKV